MRAPQGWRGWLLLALRVLLGAVWVYAGAIKIADPSQSLRTVRAYHLLAEPFVVAAGYGLPAFEVGLGMLLIVGYGTRMAAALSALLLVVFVAAIASAWARGLQIECGCFGGGGLAEATAYGRDIVRDLVLLGMSIAVVVWPRSQPSLEERSGSRPLAVAGTSLGLLVLTTGLGTAAAQLAGVGSSDPSAGVPQGVVDRTESPAGSCRHPWR